MRFQAQYIVCDSPNEAFQGVINDARFRQNQPLWSRQGAFIRIDDGAAKLELS
jgi:hypothetical protein